MDGSLVVLWCGWVVGGWVVGGGVVWCGWIDSGGVVCVVSMGDKMQYIYIYRPECQYIMSIFIYIYIYIHYIYVYL